jgi:hypothetical protein
VATAHLTVVVMAHLMAAVMAHLTGPLMAAMLRPIRLLLHQHQCNSTKISIPAC